LQEYIHTIDTISWLFEKVSEYTAPEWEADARMRGRKKHECG